MQVFPSRILQSTIGLATIVVLISLTVPHSASAQPSSTWVQLMPAKSPSARDACMMFYDPNSKEIVMFGGWNGSTYLNDTWTFDGANWTKVSTPTAPPARAAGSAYYDPHSKLVVLFGGYNRNYLNDTWLWNGATSTWTQAAPLLSPVPETSPMLFPDPVGGKVDEFGGFDGKFYQLTTWRWRRGSWHKYKPPVSPGARAAAVIGTNPVLHQTVLFGGLADVNPVNTWTYDGTTWTQQFPAHQPPQRLDVGTVYDPRFSGVVTFGGFIGQDDNATWLWNGTDWIQLAPQQSPSPREQFGMAFDPVHQQTVVFGGLSGSSLLNDTWVLQTQ